MEEYVIVADGEDDELLFWNNENGWGGGIDWADRFPDTNGILPFGEKNIRWMSADTAALEPFDNHQLVKELRSRGLAVIAFSAEDVPVWVDWDNASVTPEEWFSSQAPLLEDSLAGRGCDWLDQSADESGLPVEDVED